MSENIEIEQLKAQVIALENLVNELIGNHTRLTQDVQSIEDQLDIWEKEELAVKNITVDNLTTKTAVMHETLTVQNTLIVGDATSFFTANDGTFTIDSPKALQINTDNTEIIGQTVKLRGRLIDLQGNSIAIKPDDKVKVEGGITCTSLNVDERVTVRVVYCDKLNIEDLAVLYFNYDERTLMIESREAIKLKADHILTKGSTVTLDSSNDIGITANRDIKISNNYNWIHLYQQGDEGIAIVNGDRNMLNIRSDGTINMKAYHDIQIESSSQMRIFADQILTDDNDPHNRF